MYTYARHKVTAGLLVVDAAAYSRCAFCAHGFNAHVCARALARVILYITYPSALSRTQLIENPFVFSSLFPLLSTLAHSLAPRFCCRVAVVAAGLRAG